MADAHGRFSGLGVALTSTGAGAGNAVGAMIEALNANTPLLHITGQVEKAYLDADAGFIHETRDQLGFLRACSKRAYRVNSPEQAVAVIQRAILDAQTVPCGPVAVEIPIDIQSSLVSRSVLTEPLAPAPLPKADDAAVERLHQRLKQAKRPLLWLGGGALACGDAVRKLADAGVAVISSTHGRGILPDSHPRSLRAFHNSPSIEAILTQCDLTLVAGSRLRSNETRTWTLPLPRRWCRSTSIRRRPTATIWPMNRSTATVRRCWRRWRRGWPPARRSMPSGIPRSRGGAAGGERAAPAVR